jgi:hypothetical protein
MLIVYFQYFTTLISKEYLITLANLSIRLIRDTFMFTDDRLILVDQQTSFYKFEFGKKFNVQPVYVALMTVAHQNQKRLNS